MTRLEHVLELGKISSYACLKWTFCLVLVKPMTVQSWQKTEIESCNTNYFSFMFTER